MKKPDLPLSLLPLLASFALTSCAARIYSKGNHADLFRYGVPREEIVKALGTPIQSGKDETNFLYQDYDQFILKGPVHDHHWMQMVGMASAMTLGLEGIAQTPGAIAWSLDRSPKRVTVYYRSDGIFGRIKVEKEPQPSNPIKSPSQPPRLRRAGGPDR